MATVYTHGHHESVLRSHRWRTAQNSAAYLLPYLRSGQSLVDIGCGPGTITADLADLVAPGLVTASEVVESALALARAEVARRGTPNVTFAVADAQALDFPDDSFDVVHAHQVLQHLGDPVGALGELRRVARPGGVVAVRDSDYAAFAWYPRLSALDEWLALYHAVTRRNGAEPDAGRYLLAWAHAAGFTDVTASSSTWCFASPADRAWWGGLWADRMVESDLAAQALAAGLATEPDLHRLAAGWREWAAHPDGWFSVLHAEIIARS